MQSVSSPKKNHISTTPLSGEKMKFFTTSGISGHTLPKLVNGWYVAANRSTAWEAAMHSRLELAGEFTLTAGWAASCPRCIRRHQQSTWPARCRTVERWPAPGSRPPWERPRVPPSAWFCCEEEKQSIIYTAWSKREAWSWERRDRNAYLMQSTTPL